MLSRLCQRTQLLRARCVTTLSRNSTSQNRIQPVISAIISAESACASLSTRPAGPVSRQHQTLDYTSLRACYQQLASSWVPAKVEEVSVFYHSTRFKPCRILNTVVVGALPYLAIRWCNRTSTRYASASARWTAAGGCISPGTPPQPGSVLGPPLFALALHPKHSPSLSSSRSNSRAVCC